MKKQSASSQSNGKTPSRAANPGRRRSKMKEELIKEVLKVGTVDNRGYRYMLEDHGKYLKIVKIRKSLLGSTASLPGNGNWSTACIIEVEGADND
jgi:hypothetical protein